MRISLIFTSILLSCLLQAQELIPYRFNSSWGFADENGYIIIPTEYDEVTSFDKLGYARVAINNEWGIINKNGEIIVPLKYRAIFNFSEGLAAVCKGGEYHWLQGEIIGGSWGFVNEKGEEVISFNYHRAESFYNGHAIVQISNDNWGNWGVIDKTGKQILLYNYPSYSFDMRPFPGLRWDENEKGKLLYRPSQNDEVWRQIDLKGNLTGKKVIDIHGERASNNSPITIEKNGKYTLKSASGKLLTDYIYDQGIHFYNDDKVAVIRKNLKYGLIDVNGKETIKPVYDALNIRGKLLEFKVENKFAVADLAGKVLSPYENDEIRIVSENIYCINLSNGYLLKFIDGSIANEEIFDQTGYSFEDGLLKVKKNGLWGFVDLDGKLAIPCKYPYAEDFENGLAKVDLNIEQYKIPDEGYINKKGVEFFISEKKINIIPEENGFYILTNEIGKNIKSGIRDVIEIAPNLISFRENDKLNIMNEEGKIMIQETINDFIPSCLEMDPELNDGTLCYYAGITNDTVYIYDKFLNKSMILSETWNKMDMNLFQEHQLVIERKNREILKTAHGNNIGKSYEKIYYVNNYLSVYGKNDSSAILNMNGELISEFKKQNLLILENHYVSYPKTSKSNNEVELFDYSGKKINQQPLNIFNQSYNTMGFYITKNLKTKKEGYYWNGILKEAIYTEISTWEIFDRTYSIVNDNGKIELFDIEGKLAFSESFESIHTNKEFAVVKTKGKYGILSTQGDILIYYLKCEYDFIPELTSLNAPIAVKKDGKYEYVNLNGEKKFIEEFDYCTQFNDYSFAIAEKNEKTGIIDLEGNWIIQPNYDYLDFHSNNNNNFVFSGRQNGKLILLDASEKSILPTGIDSVSFDYLENYDHILALNENKKGVINFNGETIVPIKYLDVKNFYLWSDQNQYKYFLVKTETGYGFLDSTGKEISLMNYDEQSQNDDYYVAAELNLIPVKRKGKYGALNPQGKEILRCEYQKINWYPFDGDNKHITILKNGKWGMIGKDAKMILEPIYDNIEIDYEIMELRQTEYPVFSLKQKGKYGLCDLIGQIIYPCIYTEIRPDYDCDIPNHISLSNGKKKGVGNAFGTLILVPEYEKINCGRFGDNDFFMVWKSNKVSIYYADGSPFNNKQYDSIDWDGYDNLAMVKSGNAWFYLKEDGTEVSIEE
jgi:hypothetical protein